MIPAVVPVKALAESKSRLFPERARRDVEALSLAMMGDVIACLRAVPAIARVVVVTPDPAVATYYRKHDDSVTSGFERGDDDIRRVIEGYLERHPERRGTAFERAVAGGGTESAATS